jgi:hypothetical protein
VGVGPLGRSVGMLIAGLGFGGIVLILRLGHRRGLWLGVRPRSLFVLVHHGRQEPVAVGVRAPGPRPIPSCPSMITYVP